MNNRNESVRIMWITLKGQTVQPNGDQKSVPFASTPEESVYKYVI